MPLTILLAKVFGIYLIILGAAIMLRRRYFVPVFGAFVEERLTRAIVASAELLTGLFLIVAHNVWTPAAAAVITLIGWLAVIEGTAYLLLPDEVVERVFRTLNTPAWYVFGGVLSIVIGVYLAGFGFGWF